MKVREIPFIGRRPNSSAVTLNGKPGIGWSRPLLLPEPVRFNGNLCSYFNLSHYGAIRLSAGKDGSEHYLGGDTTLPEGVDKTASGWLIIPWGENIKLSGCGVHVKMYKADGVIVIDYEVKDADNPRLKYLYRVEFPLREANIIRCYYYHCVSRYNTYVGVVKEPKDFIEWPLKENTPYMKKALEFDTSADTEEPKPVEPPVQPTPQPPIEPPTPKDWQNVYESHLYRVQELR